MKKEILIQVDSLSRSYGNGMVVNDISFHVQRGEILGFLGPNGAGKSTTMQMIAGVLAATSGSIRIAGIDIYDSPKEVKHHIGFLPERPPVYPDLTVDEYLHYCAHLRHMSKSETVPAIAESKSRCGLERVGERLIGNLSKGYWQRIGIAQAIIHSPAVIILDEPTSGLDPIQIKEIRELMRELGQYHSIILSTHILSEVQSLCDRALIINQGKLVLDQVINHLRKIELGVSGVELKLLNPPTSDDFLGLNGVKSAVAIENGVFRLEFNENNHGVIDALLNAILENDWKLCSMNPLGDSLETMFMRLISGDHDGPSDGQSAPGNE